MPRNSLRMKRICWLKKTLKKRYKFAFLRELFEYKDDNEDEVDAVLVQSLELAKGHRYHQKRSKYRKARTYLFEADLKDEGGDDDEVPWLTK